MTKYGLRARVYILTILPTLLIGSLLASYFTFHRNQQLDQLVIDQGISIIEPLAITSESGVFRHNRERIKKLISASHRKQSEQIRTIAVFNRNNQLFVTSNYHKDFQQLQIPSGQPLPDKTQVEIFDDYILLRTPIWSESEDGLMTLENGQPTQLGYIAMIFNKERTQLLQMRDTAVALVILLFGSLTSLLFSYLLIKNFSQPLSNIVSVVNRIRQGRLDARVTGSLTGELGVLQKGVNAMAKSLADYHEEMHQSVDQATSDLRETLEQIEIQNIELDMAKKEAQQAAQAKSEFLANMSHELRTPLNGVLGFARQLFKTPLSPGQKDYLHTIENSANNLLSIINDILDFSKLDANQLTLEHIAFNLREATHEVVSLLAPSAHDKQLEFIDMIDPDVPEGIYGDPLRYAQILTNLIGNAIKFTSHGHVLLQIQGKPLDNNRIKLQINISDTGIGITQEQQKQLFQAFKQADTSISREYGGTGLGLVITKRLVQQMAGNITIDSTPQQGSTFSVSITVDIAEGVPTQTLPLSQLKGSRVLVFEAHSLSRKRYLTLCERWGIVATSCGALQQFEECLHQNQYDAVLLGYSQWHNLSPLLSQIKLTKAHCDNLLVAINSVDPELSLRILQAGASHCLSKPLSEHKLAQALADRQGIPLTDVLAEQIRVPRQKRNLRILAVDDNSANLKLISTMLADLVATVDGCRNGQEAVEISEINRYDLIFMDIQMPILDGISASQVIRRGQPNSATPIIAVTAHAITGEKEQLLSQGMDDYLAKPINEADLIDILERWCPKERGQQTGYREVSDSFDWQQALTSAANKPELALEMLRQLLESFDDLRHGITQAQSGDITSKELEQILHKFHGGCAYTGVRRLKQLAATCETALRDNQGIEMIDPELLEMFDEMDKVYTLVTPLLKPAALNN
jgi:two-component system sensor histidine kinase BarA